MRQTMLRALAGAVAATTTAIFGHVAAAQTGALDNIAVPALSGPEVATYMMEKRRAAKPVDGESATRVYGGRKSQPGAWPFQVALIGEFPPQPGQDGPSYNQFCGGSLISRQWVLTAAHCVVQRDDSLMSADKLIIQTGATRLGAGDMRRVARIIVHENYDPILFENDIALIKLAEPISGSNGPVGAVKVLPGGSPSPQGQGVVMGWGLIEGDQFTDDLIETDIDVVSNDACNRGMAEQTRRDFGEFLLAMGTSNRIPRDKLEEAYSILAANIGPSLTDNMICAGVASGSRTSCNGDSGGPLIMRAQDGNWIQVGIVSWGKVPLGSTQNCGHENLYSVYTRVSNYFDWIGNKLANN